MSSEQDVVEEFKELVSDTDQPMDKKAPGSSFMVVALSYLAVLALTLMVIGLVIWLV